jgi:hypothetical protein
MLSSPTAPTKRNKNQGKRKKRNKDQGHRNPTGSCRLDQTADASVLVVEAADTFEGKSLTLVHRATLPEVGDFTQQMVVKLGQQLVVQLDLDKPAGAASRLRSRFGIGFEGIQDSEYIIDGSRTAIGGSIDGRELVSRPVAEAARDPNGWEFADGGPMPQTASDPRLLTAVQSLLGRAGDEIAACAGAQPRAAAAAAATLQLGLGSSLMPDWLGGGVAHAANSKKKRRARKNPGRVGAEANPTVCDEVTFPCLLCWGTCFSDQVACCIATFGLGCVLCYLKYETCLDQCDQGVCCPVECGSDFPSSCCCDGQTCCEGNCCDQDTEACWPGGVCCQKGLAFCLGKCCPPGTTCKEDICCGANQAPCFGDCCPDGEECREQDLCCPKDVVDCAGVCCPSDQDDCQNDVCCPKDQVVCGTTCCEPGEKCKPSEGGGEQKVCCPPDQVCNQVCCDDLSRCFDPEHSECCSIFHQVCNGVCCNLGEVCLGRACCPAGQVCGETCCPAGNLCGDPASADCRACDEGHNPCPLDIEGAPSCCPKDTLCCGSGDCCAPGVGCCDKGGGLKCDPNCLK